MIRIHHTDVFRDIPKDLREEINKELDFIYNVSQFIPSPLTYIANKFILSETEAMYVMLAWYDLRCKQSNHKEYGNGNQGT